MYTVDYFINKFEAIPEEKWGTGALCRFTNGKGCAYYHCGGYSTKEGTALSKVFGDLNMAYQINDDFPENIKYKQPTPKQRILAALYDIKKMQNKIEPTQDTVIERPFPADHKPKVKMVVKYVAVPETISHQAVMIITSN